MAHDYRGKDGRSQDSERHRIGRLKTKAAGCGQWLTLAELSDEGQHIRSCAPCARQMLRYLAATASDLSVRESAASALAEAAE